MNDKVKTQELLSGIHTIVTDYEKSILESGERFNVFEILGRTTDECGTHSAFIAEMLKPSGLHGFGFAFLKLFIDELGIEKISSFDVGSTSIEIERVIGNIVDDYEEGGRIDIVLYDKKGNGIIIENKIYAVDQYKQLYRYYQYSKSNFQRWHILYLTLDGKCPEEHSTTGKHYTLVLEKDFSLVSYEKHILNWLSECLKISISNNQVYLTITQYYQTIKNLTGNSNKKNMEKEIADLICQNSENFLAAYNVNKHFHLITKSLLEELISQLKKLTEKKGLEFKKDANWGFGTKADDYLYFYIPQSKYQVHIRYCFDKVLDEFNIGVHSYALEDKMSRLHKELKSEVSKKLSYFGTDRKYSNWLYIHYYSGEDNESPFGGLKNWNENHILWLSIKNGELANFLFKQVEEIMEILEGIEL